MKKQQHLRQFQLCAKCALLFLTASFVGHQVQTNFKITGFDFDFFFLWIAVLMLAQGSLQLVRYLTASDEEDR